MASKTNITTVNGITLTRPITEHLAKKLEAHAPAIIAANDRGESLASASQSTGIEHNNLMNYIGILGIKWANKKTYKPRRKPTEEGGVS